MATATAAVAADALRKAQGCPCLWADRIALVEASGIGHREGRNKKEGMGMGMDGPGAGGGRAIFRAALRGSLSAQKPSLCVTA